MVDTSLNGVGGSGLTQTVQAARIGTKTSARW
jgi:hypothetical protein